MSSPPSAPEFPIPTAATPLELFQNLEAYPWAADQEFQSGLEAILGPPSASATAAQTEDLALRARCFYYSRKSGTEVDFPAYKAWREGQPAEELSPLALPRRDVAEAATPAQNAAEEQDLQVVPGEAEAAANGAAASTASGQYPSKFAQIVDLIQSGKPIPGIKEIPDTVLVGQGTESSQIRREKPWEKARSSQSEGAVGTF